MTYPNETRGSKYSANLTTKDVAKAVRGDIKTAIKNGELPKGLKVSVRIETYSGGSSINLNVTKFDGKIINPAYIFANKLNSYRQYNYRTSEAERIERTLELMVNEYRRDATDSMVDYFDCNFYVHVNFRLDTSVEVLALETSVELSDMLVAKRAGTDFEAALSTYDKGDNE